MPLAIVLAAIILKRNPTKLQRSIDDGVGGMGGSEGRDGDPFNEFCQRVRQVSDEVDLCDQRPGSLYMAPVYALL